MITTFSFTKLVVRDVEVSTGFYEALGLKVVMRNAGGEGLHRQTRCLMSATGEMGPPTLALAEFHDAPPPPLPTYPGTVIVGLGVDDVAAAVEMAVRMGGTIVMPAQDYPPYDLCAAIVSDLDGNAVELTGSVSG